MPSSLSLSLRLSLGANLLLGALVLGLLLRERAAPAWSGPASGSLPPASAAPAPGVDVPAAGAAGWENSMAELRRVGVPSAIIARLVVEKVAQKWTPIEADLERRYLHGEIDARRLAEQHERRAREQDAELRAALGDGFLAWDVEHTVGNLYLGGHVPSEGQKRPIYDLHKTHLARLRDLEAAQRERALDDAAFETARARAESDFKTALAAIIGADRVDGLEPAGAAAPAERLRADFARLALDDVQMRELAAAHATWSAARADMARSLAETATMDGAYVGDLLALDRARDEDYRRILGDERFDAWHRAADDRVRAMRENAAAWKLDPAAIASVYSTLRAYDLAVANREHQAELAAQAGGAVDWARVQTDIAAYSREAEAALRARLGDEGFARLSHAEIISLREPDLARSALGERPRL